VDLPKRGEASTKLHRGHKLGREQGHNGNRGKEKERRDQALGDFGKREY